MHSSFFTVLERDLHFYLKNTANCQSSEISFYASAFKSLMIEESEEEFDKSWTNFKESITSSCVLRYFEQKLLPTFKKHSSIWILKEMGISDPENGLTNNASIMFYTRIPKDNHSTQSTQATCIESILTTDAHASLQSLTHTTYVL